MIRRQEVGDVDPILSNSQSILIECGVFSATKNARDFVTAMGPRRSLSWMELIN